VSDSALLNDDVRQRLDEAVTLQPLTRLTEAVKHTLQDGLRSGTLDVPAGMRQPRTDTYARRLLYRDPQGRYSMVVMTWGPGQRTPLHDHAGIWCVEGVVEGGMDVTQFDLIDDHAGPAAGGYRFEEKGRVHAAVGSAGSLIPPFEYHILANALDRPSITLHVYGGEMTSCHVFEPADGGRYVRRERALSYDD